MTTEVACVVSGSFTKGKDRIDHAIEVFEQAGIRVLSPPKGGLFYPRNSTLWTEGSYPLQAELTLSENQAKSAHISAIMRLRDRVTIAVASTKPNDDQELIQPNLRGVYSNIVPRFVYFVIPDGYLGESGLIEAGVAMAVGTQIYCDEPISPKIELPENVLKHFDVKSPEEVAKIWSPRNTPPPNIWLPKRYFRDIIRNNS